MNSYTIYVVVNEVMSVQGCSNILMDAFEREKDTTLLVQSYNFDETAHSQYLYDKFVIIEWDSAMSQFYIPDFINILLNKLKKASVKTGVKNICIAGGVAANKGLRNALQEHAKKYHWNIHIPSMQYCTDNAAMIALTGYYKLLEGIESPLSISASARATWH
jgi:hydrogenase maturation factor HypF (carbamoyltransferase family)